MPLWLMSPGSRPPVPITTSRSAAQSYEAFRAKLLRPAAARKFEVCFPSLGLTTTPLFLLALALCNIDQGLLVYSYVLPFIHFPVLLGLSSMCVRTRCLSTAVYGSK